MDKSVEYSEEIECPETIDIEFRVECLSVIIVLELSPNEKWIIDEKW